MRDHKTFETFRGGRPMRRFVGVTLHLMILTLLLLLITACTPRGITPEDLPTAITDLDALATEVVLTENAPPAGFRDSISVPEIDANLDDLSNWRYTVTLEFDGFFADTPRPATASTSATVWYDQFGSERRVVITAEGELLAGGDEAQTLEGVRIGNDSYLVREGTCQQTTGSDAQALADVGAGELIGGVYNAVPDGTKAVINGEEVWRYAFLQSDLNITSSIQIGEGGAMTLLGGELWFAPQHNAVIRFYLTLDVENATVFGSQLPVTGQAIIRYDLFDIGIDPNITVPFGC